MNKEQLIRDSIVNVSNILIYACPDKDIRIEYIRMTQEKLKSFSEWDRKRFVMLDGEELILISDNRTDHLLYVVNITGDSLLTAMAELMQLLARKF